MSFTSKYTGSQIEATFDVVNNGLIASPELIWEYGAIDSLSGADSEKATGSEANTGVCRAIGYFDVKSIAYVSVTTSPKTVFVYDAAYQYLGYAKIPKNTSWTNENILAINSNAKYLRIRSEWGETPETVVGTVSVYMDRRGNRLNALELANEMTQSKVISKKIGKNLFNKSSDAIVKGVYLNAEGKLTSGDYAAYYYVADFIEAEPETSYAVTDYFIGAARICFYDEFKIVLANISGTELIDTVGVFTTPANTKYIRLSGKIENIDSNQLEKGTAITSYEPYTNYYPSLENALKIERLKEELAYSAAPDTVSATSLSNGKYLELEVPNIKQNNQISFYGKVKTLGTVTVAHGLTQPYASAFVEIDSTAVRVYAYGSSKILTEEFDHGLTVKDFISVIIRVKDDLTADLIIGTTGAVFSQSVTWKGCSGLVEASVSGGSLTECQLSFYCEDYKKPIWAYGDSYFDYWPKVLNRLGVSDWLVDGYSGRNSVNALASLKKALTKSTPKVILWCLGMNDGDSASLVNTNWENTVDELKSICKEKHITLVLSTVPNTPTINNSFKNAYVRESGYRYVDVSKAVGAEENTAWYDGLLNADNIHPSDTGKDVIAYRVLADLPELLNNK